LVRAGLLGAKSGRGFFNYDDHGRRTDRLPDDQPGLG
jgi:3-hydroxyacyl-CoA dehydrogenase